MHMWFDAQLDQKILDGLYITETIQEDQKKKYYRRQTQKTQKTKQKEKNYEHLLDSEQVIECNFSLL